MSEDPIIKQYRQTLGNLHRLRRRYMYRLNMKMVRVLDEEIDEISCTLAHLTKGVRRWKWD